MRRRTKAALVAGLMAVALVFGAGAAYADDDFSVLKLICAAFERESGLWILAGCRALDNPNPQA
jgi:hypothetical protein